MSQIKILHLFSRLLSLYGEYGNLALLEKVLTQNGHSVTVERAEALPSNLSDYNMIYTGAGTEGDIMAAAQRLSAGAALDYINQGGFWLATGNSMALLGGNIEYCGTTAPGIGAVDMQTVMSREKRWLGDVVTEGENIFGRPVIGYVNTSSVYTCTQAPLFTFKLGDKLGNDKQNGADGFFTNEIFATQLTGPLLVKNPAALAYVYKRLTGEQLALDAADPITLAYENAFKQLSARIV